MPRKKHVEYINATFYLDGDVTVTISKPKDAPAGAVRHLSTHNTFSIETGDGARVPLSATNERSVQGGDPVPQSNGPLEDTPEIKAMKANLPRHVFSSADAFGDADAAREFEQAVLGGATFDA